MLLLGKKWRTPAMILMFLLVFSLLGLNMPLSAGTTGSALPPGEECGLQPLVNQKMGEGVNDGSMEILFSTSMGVQRINSNTLRLTATSTGGSNVQYRFDMRVMDSGGGYTVIRDFSPDPVFTWNGAQEGVSYEMVVHAQSQQGGYHGYYVVFGNTDPSAIVPFRGINLRVTSVGNLVNITAIPDGGTNVIYALQLREVGSQYNPLDPSNPYQASPTFLRTLDKNEYEIAVHAIDVAAGAMVYHGDYFRTRREPPPEPLPEPLPEPPPELEHTVKIGGEQLTTMNLSPGQSTVLMEFVAVAEPPGAYRYQWNFDDGSELVVQEKQHGENASIMHAFKQVSDGDRFEVTVYLLPLEGGTPLAQDMVVVQVSLDSATQPAPPPTPPTDPEEAVKNPYGYQCGWNPDYSQVIRREEMYMRHVHHIHKDSGRLHGIWIDWHDDQKTRFKEVKCHYQGGLHGMKSVWAESGVKVEEHRYQHGKAHGVHTSWHENGVLMREGTYVEGEATGLFIDWNESGQVTLQRYYHATGAGPQPGDLPSLFFPAKVTVTQFYDNGNPRYHGTSVNNVRQGTHYWWNEDGSYRQIIEY